MDFLIEILDFLSRNRFKFLMLVSIIFVLSKIASAASGANTKILDGRKKVLSRLATLMLLISILILIFGTDLTNMLIYEHGHSGEGLVVDTYETGDLYNEEPVVKYDVLIKTQSGETVETSFESMDFNLYPAPEGKHRYPSQGVRFTVKHLESNPKAFIIVTNDDSPYAAGTSCDEQIRKLNKAKSQYDFAPNNTSYREEYRKAIELYLNLDCDDNSVMVEFYKQQISKLE